MQTLIRIIEKITDSVGGIAALVVIPLTLATCYEVMVRYVFGAPTIWAFELGYTLMGIHFLLGGALTLKHRAHVRIDLIYAQLPVKIRAAIDLTLYAMLVVPALWFLTARLGEFAWGAWLSGEQTGQSAWNPPIWPLRFLITASFGLLLLQVVAECLKCIEILRGRAGSDATGDDAAVFEGVDK
ncbi:MAG: TRAP transporter small permease subunit [Burkholderiaceae bacterium]